MDSRIQEIVETNIMLRDYYLVDEEWKRKLWSIINGDFGKIQSNISFLFDILEVVGYYPERKTGFRSRMHDVTHAIYASQADYFIIEDKKFKKKCESVFHFLRIPTRILSYSEFRDVNNG